MGRGGGGGGGHRSSGGSHGRSFGGSSSRSSRGGSTRSSSRGGSSYRGSYSSRPSYHHTHIHVGGSSYRGSRYGGGGYYGGSAFATVVTLVVVSIMVFVLFVAMMGLSGGSGSHGVTKSTVERERLEPYGPFSRDCIDDDAGWIHDERTLLKGMESFYKATGIQPALAIYDEINGQKYLKDSEIMDFMYGEYDGLIGHERGLLVLFCEYADSDWYVYYMAGEDAQTVMDSEACNILVDYVHGLYTDSSYSDEEFFAAVFEKTGERIMSVTPTVASKIPVIVAGIVIIVLAVAGVKALKQKHKRDAEKARETERILNSPIDRI